MKEQEFIIRIASIDDAEELLKIYAPYVEKTAITFEYDVPSIEEFKRRIEITLQRYPYIVIENENEILGYAYASAFINRSAYDWSAETTIYIKEDIRKMGLGKKLYNAIENLCKAQNIINLNACIGYPEKEDKYLTKNSKQFHEHLGYAFVGEFHKCGYKFERWYNMIWMEKILMDHPKTPLEVIPFSQLDENIIKSCLNI